MASTSDSVMPAVSQARSMVGTIASRCARLATSGTTPPKRACSSTLLATASASRVRPRTMPTPVSSQEVSMPRTRGSLMAPMMPGQDDGVQVDLGALVARSSQPFVRHVVAPSSYDAAWVRGDAVVLHGERHTVVLGPAADAGPLVASLARTVEPTRLTVEEAAADAVRRTW